MNELFDLVDLHTKNDPDYINALPYYQTEMSFLSHRMKDDNKTTYFFLVNEENVIVGWTRLGWFAMDCGQDDQMLCSSFTSIHPQFQGKGYSKLLIEAKANFLKDNGYKRVLLSRYTTNGLSHIKKYESIYENAGINVIPHTY